MSRLTLRQAGTAEGKPSRRGRRPTAPSLLMPGRNCGLRGPQAVLAIPCPDSIRQVLVRGWVQLLHASCSKITHR